MGKPVQITTQPPATVPRTFGRRAPLPLYRAPADPCTEVLALNFVCSRSPRSILNCAVVGTDTRPYFHVVTRADYRPGETVFSTNLGRDVAAVEWVPHGGGALVELHNKTLQKQLVSSWLGVSRDASYRVMSAHGQTYVWVPRGESICLYHWNPTRTADIPELLARITKEDDLATLEISLPAIEAGLLEMCVVCVVLFQSGCRID
ncbi:hypothetical protein DFH09DRAFT_1031524 [Mycena vulgaris]|nr:hypothetical protein DFH09DRAFT_1031524 [Mycena vulgaris]